jgi:hypothetical protein
MRKNNQGVACRDCLTLASVKFRAARGMKTHQRRKPQVAFAINELIVRKAQIEEQLNTYVKNAGKQLNEVEAQIALLKKQVSQD